MFVLSWRICGILLQLMLSLSIIIINGEPLGTFSSKNANKRFKHSKSPDMVTDAYGCEGYGNIKPCKCYVNSYTHHKIMDCSDVESEAQLKEIFNTKLTGMDFDELTILANENLTSLKDGDLGHSAFKEISVTDGVLTEVDDFTFIDSRNTLTYLALSYNQISTIPDLSFYSILDTLAVYGSNMTEYQYLESKTLTKLYLGRNSINEIPLDAFKTLPMLDTLRLADMRLKKINPGTFTYSEHLKYLDLNSNQLTWLPKGAVELHGNYTTLVLKGNRITKISSEAIASVNCELDLSDNLLTELPEKTFRPLLEKYVRLHIGKNPLKCGCDIAWLIEDQLLLKRLRDLDDDNLKPTCSDGEALTNLDPELYKTMCHNVTLV